jgi:hypothetical protein
MSHLQCPNIKNNILVLRNKICELESLKTRLLQDDSMYNEYLLDTLMDVDDSVRWIEDAVDEIANETVLPDLIRARKILNIGSKYSQGRLKVRSISGEREEFHINIKGNPVYSDKYKIAVSFIDNAARVTNKAGECFHIDRQGKPKYIQRYLTVSDYFRGKANVETFTGEKFKIDLDGNRIID